MDSPSEEFPVGVLFDMSEALGAAINSLGGKESEGIREHFLFWISRHINCAAEGFVFLRKSGRIDASTLMVRSAIEAMLKLQAIRADPELLYRFAFDEFTENEKIGRPAALSAGETYDELLAAREKKDFKDAYSRAFPAHKLVDAKIDLRSAANAAGISAFYDSHYRLYSKFTHALFEAAAGGWNDFRTADNRTMALCVLVALESVHDLGGEVARLSEFQQRLSSR